MTYVRDGLPSRSGLRPRCFLLIDISFSLLDSLIYQPITRFRHFSYFIKL